MEIAEVGKILTLMASYDQRKVGETDIMAWSELIGSFDYADAKDAVLAHYAATADRIMPADIVRFAKARRGERDNPAPGSVAERIETDIPDADPDDVHAYIMALRENRMRPYDDGTARARPMRALMARVFPQLPDRGEQ